METLHTFDMFTWFSLVLFCFSLARHFLFTDSFVGVAEGRAIYCAIAVTYPVYHIHEKDSRESVGGFGWFIDNFICHHNSNLYHDIVDVSFVESMFFVILKVQEELLGTCCGTRA